MEHFGPVISSYGLDKSHNITNLSKVYWNLHFATLMEHAVKNGEGHIGEGGTLIVNTGKYTGRSPKDRFLVKDENTKDQIDWNDINQPITTERFESLRDRMIAHYEGKPAYVRDCYVGADPKHRIKVRVLTEGAWWNLFVHNMFIEVPAEERADFVPEFTVLQAPSFTSDNPEADGLNSETLVLGSFTHKMLVIGGSQYGGEIKKGLFGVLNYLLPKKDIMPMHCSANIGEKGSAVFFGLSGTGKTTLSADAHRKLIGDDEHGWSDDGLFNFEGGCYAKLIDLDKEAEPVIAKASTTHGSILENIGYNKDTMEIDFTDSTITQNTRVSYDLNQIPNRSLDSMGPHPTDVVMLTADAYGVLPPISKLTPEQASYHFISGYTAKVAGTERGVTEPVPTFSACFGGPFMPRHPGVYGKLLAEKIKKHEVRCWLVNTGWSGGTPAMGVKRIKIAYTRAMVNAALEGKLDNVEFATDEFFGLSYSTSCPDVPSEVLDPTKAWKDVAKYKETATTLTGAFEENFKQFLDGVDEGVKKVLIKKA